MECIRRSAVFIGGISLDIDVLFQTMISYRLFDSMLSKIEIENKESKSWIVPLRGAHDEGYDA